MMASLLSYTRRLVLGVLIFAAFFYDVSALSAQYCSGLNTAQTPANSSIFQSNGLCYTFCLADYAFAILQGSTCWCSNNAPGDTTSTSDCSSTCPGYPDDLCGNPPEDLFGYLALNGKPSATVYGSSTAAPSTNSAQVTVTETPSVSILVMTSIPDTTSNDPTTTKTSSSSSITWTPTPSLSLETITGQVRTVTVTPTAQPTSLTSMGTERKGSSGGLSTGAAVGLTVGLVALVVLICSITFFCIRKRRKERARVAAEEINSRRGSSAGLGGQIPSRTMSENSRYVLGTDGRQVVETWEPETRDVPGSRRSRLMPVDPRLDPFAPVYQRGENKSRESVNTIRDDHDYSRRVHQQGPILRATNPDE